MSEACLQRHWWYGRLTPSLLFVPCRSSCDNRQDSGTSQQVAVDASSCPDMGAVHSAREDPEQAY